MNTNDLLYSDGFISDTDKENTKKLSKNTIYKILHDSNPITELTKHGFFNEKRELQPNKLTYLNQYFIINSPYNGSLYLMSRQFELENKVENNELTFSYKDIGELPFYRVQLFNKNNKLIDSSLYDFILCPENDKYKVITQQDSHGYFNKNDIIALNKLFMNKYKVFDKFEIKPYISGDYIENYKIIFKEEIKEIKTMKIIIDRYDLYFYGGFFRTGWCFCN